MEHTLLIPEELFEALAQRAAEIVLSRPPTRRWAVGVDGLASYLGCSCRLARELRAKGLPARKIGKRLYFNVEEVDDFLDREGAVA
jgi:Helix-turn-helix domain